MEKKSLLLLEEMIAWWDIYLLFFICSACYGIFLFLLCLDDFVDGAVLGTGRRI